MKTAYLDTNILLARWDSSDPIHEQSSEIILAIKNKKIKAIFSGIGLAEIASVVERQQQKFSQNIPSNVNLSLEYIRKILRITNLEIYDIAIPLEVSIGKQHLSISAVNWLCIEVANDIGLRTLDNLHLAIASLIKQLTGEPIDYFVSNDKGILAKAVIVKKKYDFAVASPKELIKLEKLI